MNRNFFILLFIFPFSMLHSQISVDHIENFSMGDKASYIIMEMKDSVSPGKSGKNVKWNFTKLPTQGKDLLQTIESSSPLPQISEYNMVEHNSDSTYVFLKREKDTLYYTAYYDQKSNFLINYPTAVPFMTYPINYGQEIKKEVTRTYTVKNMHFNGKGYFKTTFDGIGQLELPGKTYEKVVRIKFEQIFTDKENTYGSTSKISTVSYAWFDMETKHSVLKIDYTAIYSAYYNETKYTYQILK